MGRNDRVKMRATAGGCDVRVWWGEVGDFAELVDVLDRDELARMQRFRRSADQRAYVARHAGLRVVLANVLGTTPRDIRFTRRPCVHCGAAHGKPALERAGPEFSLTRSGDWFAVALHRGGAIGVDIERPRARRDDTLIQSCCTPDELAEVERGDSAQRWSRFLRLWCRKEAVLKASGTGIVDDLARLDVRGDIVEDAAGRSFFVTDLDLPDAIGAVAVEGPRRPVVVDRLHPP
jgi:4'-phosphopantetheinyl transferase